MLAYRARAAEGAGALRALRRAVRAGAGHPTFPKMARVFVGTARMRRMELDRANRGPPVSASIAM